MTYETAPSSFKASGLSDARREWSGLRFSDSTLYAAVGGDAADVTSRQSIERKLIELDLMFFEECSRPLDENSREGFACFMQYQPAARMPSLGAESDGRLVATWEIEGKCLSIRFADRYEIDFAITVKSGEQLKRDWGKSQIAFFVADHRSAAQIISRAASAASNY
ncbi:MULTISPECIES: hypothetical protein [unclassified Variovorax]|uniref:hypothetical protein n=1 Tax=unclassified Variovorax TaxID=663243 RepID=UPI0011AF1E01|nr:MULTISPECIES: hypothetical protein [unclassified Variovorax]